LDFEHVVNTYYRTLYRFAFSLTHNEVDASDLTQQTCYLFGKRGHQLRDDAKLKSWLLTTLHREFLGRRRHEMRFQHIDVTAAGYELPHVLPRMVEQMDANTLMESLMNVDEIYRVPLMLFYVEDMSYKEIAEVLDVPTGTIMSRLARGKARLRQLLAIEPATRDDKVTSLSEVRESHGYPTS
jgi:RNA polymerase sigma-70 factor (ECF subfamily)